MIKQIEFSKCTLKPLNENAVKEISLWAYPPPYDAYSISGHHDDYLSDSSTWGTEQFYLDYEGEIVGQVSCQLEGQNLWVGWSMAPALCGNKLGVFFVKTCVSHLRRFTQHQGPILLRVAAWNIRAIKAYEKAGFHYVETILDEIAYSDHMEDFWVMKLN